MCFLQDHRFCRTSPRIRPWLRKLPVSSSAGPRLHSERHRHGLDFGPGINGCLVRLTLNLGAWGISLRPMGTYLNMLFLIGSVGLLEKAAFVDSHLYCAYCLRSYTCLRALSVHSVGGANGPVAYALTQDCEMRIERLAGLATHCITSVIAVRFLLHEVRTNGAIIGSRCYIPKTVLASCSAPRDTPDSK